MVVALFPLALGADPERLARIAPGEIWVALLMLGAGLALAVVLAPLAAAAAIRIALT